MPKRTHDFTSATPHTVRGTILHTPRILYKIFPRKRISEREELVKLQLEGGARHQRAIITERTCAQMGGRG